MSDAAIQAPAHSPLAPSAPAAFASSGSSDDGRFSLARGLAKRRGLFGTPKRKFAAALIASMLVHLILGAFATVEPPEEKMLPLTARFMQLPPPPVPVVAAKPAPKAKPKTAKPRPATAAEAPVAIAVAEPVVDSIPVPEPEPAVAPVVAEAKPEPESIAEPVPPPVVEPPPAPPPAPPARMPPKKIELGYTAYLGEQKFEVGPVNLKFTHDNGRYNLKVTGRGRGLAALLYPGTFTGESVGMITAEGLRPDKFIEERGNPDKRREITFDHEKRLLNIPDKEPIAFEGAPHDALTWIVQFYFAMPKGDAVTLSVGTSRRMDVYTLTRSGEEEIEAPTGDVDPATGTRALRTVKTQVWKGARKPDADGKPVGSAQFWLAPEWHFVPFRIKVVSAQGRSASFELVGVNAE